MASSLLAGVSGLRAHQTLLDVVGNNLANVNTTGFKSQRVLFADLLSDTKKPATGAVDGRIGGTNPIQVGLGVKLAAIDTNLAQGNIEATGGDLDLAIEGDGFFVVNDGVGNLYTRAGAFIVDEENFMVDASTGNRVQRFGTVGEGDSTAPAFQTSSNSDIFIPFGESIAGQPTQEVVLQGNLTASAVGPLQEVVQTTQAFTESGAPATAATLLNNLDDSVAPYIVGDQILIGGSDTDGSAVNATVAVDATSTVGDLLSAISAAFSGATASVDASGNIVLQADNTGPAQLFLTLADDSANTGSVNFSSHLFAVVVEGKDGDTETTSIEVFDSQGTPRFLSLTFQKVSNNLWDMVASIAASDGTLIDNEVRQIRFNEDGSFGQVTGTGSGDPNIEVQFTNMSTPQLIDLSFGTPNEFDGLIQVGGNSSAAAISQDGFSAGFLADVSVSADGVIEGMFTNGRTMPIAQLAMSSFANPAGLQREGNNYFSFSDNSGIPLIGGGLSGGRGSVVAGTLESSNVDVAFEFTRLIVAQRGFQVNARTITVTDEVLEELANTVR